MVNLSDQQAAGIEKIKHWYAGAGDGFSADVFRLFGPAGTGKTTMAKAIPAALGATRTVFGTFTGKAAHVLRGKGATPVSTIHSAIYFPTTSAEALARLREARDELAELEHVFHLADAELARRNELETQIPVLEADARRLSWELNLDSEWAQADLIILDEVSMVGAKLAADIEAMGVPIVVLGDPAQLPPVEGGGYYTNAEPDWLLDEIHRQALESPVLELATRIRLSQGEALGMTAGDKRRPSVREAMEADQILVWSNKRRWAMINAVRGNLGRPLRHVVPGDRIMCLTNNKDLAVFNGQQFDVLQVQPGALGPTLTVLDLDNGVQRTIPTYADGFMGQDAQVQAKNSGAGMRGGRMLATFAQAITVHKAQGSEWNHVYVVDETPTMIWAASRKEGQRAAVAQARQWAYTAVTRAAEKITISEPTRR
jgi:exodeoxyribonuclease-5